MNIDTILHKDHTTPGLVDYLNKTIRKSLLKRYYLIEDNFDEFEDEDPNFYHFMIRTWWLIPVMINGQSENLIFQCRVRRGISKVITDDLNPYKKFEIQQGLSWINRQVFDAINSLDLRKLTLKEKTYCHYLIDKEDLKSFRIIPVSIMKNKYEQTRKKVKSIN